MKARLYKNKTNGELLRYYQRILKDIDDCKALADKCGNSGAAAEHFLRGAKSASQEAELCKKELEYRGVLQ